MFAALLAGFALLLFYLNSYPNVWIEASVSMIVVIVVATALVYMGMAEEIIALQFGTKHRRELWAYVLLGSLSIASGLYLALSETATLGTIALIVSPHALVFGIAEFRISQRVLHHPKIRKTLLLFAACEVELGIALIIGFRMSDSHLASLLACGAAITSLQLLGDLIYKNQAPQLAKIHTDV